MLRTVATAVVISICNAALAEPVQLSGRLISSMITDGTVVEIDTPLGTKLPIKYAADGTMSGQSGGLGFFLGASADRGRWWVQSDMLCHKWQKWFDAELQCLKIRKEGSRIHWVSRDGKSGTATVHGIASPAAAPAARHVQPQPNSQAQLQPQSRNLAVTETAPATGPAVPSAPAAPVMLPSQPTPADPPAPRSVASAVTSRPAPPRTKAQSQPSAVREKKAEPAQPAYKVVNVATSDVLNVRQGPSTEHDVIGAIPPRGRGVEITGECRVRWCPVKHQDLRGWVNSVYLESEDGAAVEGEPPKEAVVRETPDAPRSCLTREARALLARIEAQFGAMQLVSTCRPGARIAGSGRPSLHANGNAIDFKAGPQRAAVVAWLVANHRSGGIMTYPGMDHIHVDIGPHFVSLSGSRVRDWSSSSMSFGETR